MSFSKLALAFVFWLKKSYTSHNTTLNTRGDENFNDIKINAFL